MASDLPGSLEDQIVFVDLGRPGRDGAGPEVNSLQLRGSVVDGGVNQGVAIVNRLPGFIDILDFRFGEHVVSKLGRI